MSKRISATDRLKKDKKESASDALFQSTEEVGVKSRNKESNIELKRQTYYVTEELMDALMMYKAFENKDISVIVREALYEYIPEEYLERAKNKRKQK